MANITDSDGWVDVVRPEVTDMALGGNETNFPGLFFRQLASRDRFVRNLIESFTGTDAAEQSSFNTFKSLGLASIAQGRLTLVSGNPTPTADTTGATTLYYTPFNGNRIALWNGDRWNIHNLAEVSLSLSGLAVNTNYDIFLYDDSDTLTLQPIAWTSSGGGTSVRAQAISRRDGTWVKTSDDRRYLGTIRITDVAGQCEDSAKRRFVWNVENQIQRLNIFRWFDLGIGGNLLSWTYAANSGWRRARNTEDSLLEMVIGLPTLCEAFTNLTGTTNSSAVSIGLNRSNAGDADLSMDVPNSSDNGYTFGQFSKIIPEGYNYLYQVEINETDGVATFIATFVLNGQPSILCGIQAKTMG